MAPDLISHRAQLLVIWARLRPARRLVGRIVADVDIKGADEVVVVLPLLHDRQHYVIDTRLRIRDVKRLHSRSMSLRDANSELNRVIERLTSTDVDCATQSIA